MRLLLPPLALTLLLIAACSPEEPTVRDAPPDTATAAAAIARAPNDTTLFDTLRAIERRTGGHMGIAAINVESGWRMVYRGDETYPMASVAKLPMALAFLRAVDSSRFR